MTNAMTNWTRQTTESGWGHSRIVVLREVVPTGERAPQQFVFCATCFRSGGKPGVLMGAACQPADPKDDAFEPPETVERRRLGLVEKFGTLHLPELKATTVPAAAS